MTDAQPPERPSSDTAGGRHPAAAADANRPSDSDRDPTAVGDSDSDIDGPSDAGPVVAHGGAAESAGPVSPDSGMPQQWRGRSRFVACELGFGDGTRFLAALAAWRRDAHRPRRLDWLAVAPHPASREALAAPPDEPASAADARRLAAEWPPGVGGRHRLVFEGGAVVLHLAVADVRDWLRTTEATVDAFLLADLAPGRDPLENEAVFRSMARLAAVGATVATATALGDVRQALARAGFPSASSPGIGASSDAAVARFVWPGARERPVAARSRAAGRTVRTVAVVGAGLAGAAVARALAEEGLDVVVLEARGEVASGASAVASGVFHGAVGGTLADRLGAHARLARAASFEVARDARAAIAAGFASGQVEGVVRVATRARTDDCSSGTADADDATIDRHLDARDAQAITGIELRDGGRWVRFAGVIEPRGLVRAWLAAAGARVHVLVDRGAHALEQDGGRWRVVDAGGEPIVCADAVVVAAGTATPALLAPWGAEAWALRRLRGQTSRAPAGAWSGPAPRVPVTGHGHAFVDASGALVFGATAELFEAGDGEPLRLRAADHAFNVDRLCGLLGEGTSVREASLQGGVGIRLVALDRLPVVGAVPEPLGGNERPGRLGQPRHVPRVPGLFVCGAFGARGVLWSSLSGRIVAAAVTGAPMPVESPLVDAVDPARFISRAQRRATARVGG